MGTRYELNYEICPVCKKEELKSIFGDENSFFKNSICKKYFDEINLKIELMKKEWTLCSEKSCT